MVENIKRYLSVINSDYENIVKDNPSLIDFVINEVIDRVLLYLNTDTVPRGLDRILASITNNGLKRSLKERESNDVEHAISSISDNGQSISYSNEITRYFTNASDEELFSGFTSILSRYRRIKVVHTKFNEE